MTSQALRSPLRWFGGKGSMVKHILPLLPPHTHYCEPFFGGGSVLFAKPPSPLETVSDIHHGLVTFYRVLRDPELFERFRCLVGLTPYSREQWEECRALWPTETDPVRKAWAFFVHCRQVYGGDIGTGGWQMVVGEPDDSAVSRYLGAIEGLEAVHRRLRTVQVSCADFREVIPRFDAPDCLLFCDPPYVLATRAGRKRYAHEMPQTDHVSLTRLLLETRAMVVLAGYRDAATHGPLEAAGWERVDIGVPNWNMNVTRGGKRGRKTESIWSNPAATRGRCQPSLFSE